MGKKVIKKQKRWVTLKRVGKEKRYYLKLTKKALRKLKKQLHRKGRVGITVTARMRSVAGQPRGQAPHRHADVQEGRARQARRRCAERRTHAGAPVRATSRDMARTQAATATTGNGVPRELTAGPPEASAARARGRRGVDVAGAAARVRAATRSAGWRASCCSSCCRWSSRCCSSTLLVPLAHRLRDRGMHPRAASLVVGGRRRRADRDRADAGRAAVRVRAGRGRRRTSSRAAARPASVLRPLGVSQAEVDKAIDDGVKSLKGSGGRSSRRRRVGRAGGAQRPRRDPAHARADVLLRQGRAPAVGLDRRAVRPPPAGGGGARRARSGACSPATCRGSRWWR